MPSEPGRPIPYLDEIALTFPDLTIVAGHIGYPWTDEMIALAWKYDKQPRPGGRGREIAEQVLQDMLLLDLDATSLDGRCQTPVPRCRRNAPGERPTRARVGAGCEKRSSMRSHVEAPQRRPQLADHDVADGQTTGAEVAVLAPLRPALGKRGKHESCRQ
jgi:hypothetical protein